MKIEFLETLTLYFKNKKILYRYKMRLKEIKNRLNKKPSSKIRVVFLATEDSKWNYDSLYKLMRQDDKFEPILVFAPRARKNHQTPEDIAKNYNFFKKRYPETIWGYDTQTCTYKNLKEFNPDIVFYTQPWDIHKKQSVSKISHFALACYCPYPLAESPETLIVNLKTFHYNLWKHFVISPLVIEQYKKELNYHLPSLVVTGHPKLDAYLSKTSENSDKKYVIYAPHSSFPRHSWCKCATFEWNGKYILEYAKKHPEYNWIFKPHPDVYRNLMTNKIMTEQQVKEYYAAWDKIGMYYDSGDYFDMFKNSRCLITDCISWLGEYLPTGNPVIHLRSKFTVNYMAVNQKIIEHYYQAWDLEQLSKWLKVILEEGKDPMKEERLQCLSELKLGTVSAAQEIVNHIKTELGVK